MTNSKLWLQHKGELCSADIFFLFFTVYCWFLMLLDSVWQIHGDVTAHTYAQIQRAAVAHYRWATGEACVSQGKTLYLQSLFFWLNSSRKSYFFPPLFLNHLMHPLLIFTQVWLWNPISFTDSESIWIGQFRGSACEMRMHSIAHIVKESEWAVLTVFPHLVLFYNKFFVY